MNPTPNVESVTPCEARGLCHASGHLVFCSLAEGHAGDHYGIDVIGRTQYQQTWPQA